MDWGQIKTRAVWAVMTDNQTWAVIAAAIGIAMVGVWLSTARQIDRALERAFKP
jgi:hypothetical protein